MLRPRAALLVSVFLLVVLLAPAAAVRVPPAYNPWAPLDLTAAPNVLTSFKLARLERQPELCLSVLAASSLRYSRVPDRVSNVGCPILNAVRIEGVTATASPGGFVATCPLAAAWVLFEREVLQPAARRHVGQPVGRVRHLGSYACRNIYGREQGRRSEHASANAVDLGGFILADGREITVLRHWRAAGTPEAAFLRAVHEGACRFFDVVLGPDYNAAHRDHFHLDMGRSGVCR